MHSFGRRNGCGPSWISAPPSTFDVEPGVPIVWGALKNVVLTLSSDQSSRPPALAALRSPRARFSIVSGRADTVRLTLDGGLIFGMVVSCRHVAPDKLVLIA
jgi:hypothetical protein